MTIQEGLARILEGHDLSRDDAREVMGEIIGGQATPAQIGGFLIALRLKGETADEIAGCAEAMREHVLAVHPKRDDLVDTAGTGGDGQTQQGNQTGQGQNNGALTPYQQVYSDFYDYALTSLDRNYVPLSVKDYVRDYFSSLDPTQ